MLNLVRMCPYKTGHDSSVGIATHYGVDGPGIESRWGGGEIFRTRPDQPWGPPSLLYNGYRVSFPGVKRPGRGVDHPPPSSAEVKERVELYLYTPFGPSWPVLGWTLPLPLPLWIPTYNWNLTSYFHTRRRKHLVTSTNTLLSVFSIDEDSEYQMRYFVMGHRVVSERRLTLKTKVWCLHRQGQSTLRNVDQYSSKVTASYLRRLESHPHRCDNLNSKHFGNVYS